MKYIRSFIEFNESNSSNNRSIGSGMLSSIIDAINMSIEDKAIDILNKFPKLLIGPYVDEQETSGYDDTDDFDSFLLLYKDPTKTIQDCATYLIDNEGSLWDSFLSWFEDWVSETEIFENIKDSDVPVWYWMSRFENPERLYRPLGLIHFTNSVNDILDKGFEGFADMESFSQDAIATDSSRVHKVLGKGVEYAFLLDDYINYEHSETETWKYGNDAVVWSGTGIKVYHNQDKEWQIIFDVSSVKNIIGIYHDGSNYIIKKGGGIIDDFRSKNFMDTLKMVKNRF